MQNGSVKESVMLRFQIFTHLLEFNYKIFHQYHIYENYRSKVMNMQCFVI